MIPMSPHRPGSRATLPPPEKECASRGRIGHHGGVKVCPVCQREYPANAVQCADDGVPLVAMVTDHASRTGDLVGQIIEGRYKIERVVGKGGMGTVYACRHVVVGKIAAIKVLQAGADKSEAVLQRFVREAQTANLLKSRHIVEVSDFGQLPTGELFVVMELLEGQDLSRAMRSGLERPGLVHVFTQVAETLQLAHDKGIVHRDLKPDNVFLVNEAGDPLFVKLLDFGIAKILHGDSKAGLTETGVILGTPYFMSPEQARADPLDHRSDIYSLGVMMYRAFTGKLPFMADSTMGVLTRHITEAPVPPSQLTTIDQATEALILRCLAKRPAQRYQSMREVVDALSRTPYRAQQPGTPPVTGSQPAWSGPGTGRHAQAPSGAYAPSQTPQTFAPQPTPGGPYPQGMSGPYPQAAMSGPHPQAGVSSSYPQISVSGPSGAYPQAAVSGGQPQMPSGPYPQAAVSGPSGAYPQAAMSGAQPQMPSGAYAGAPSLPGAPPAIMPEAGTTRGLAANSMYAAPPPRGVNTALLIAAGLGMASLGAVVAFFLLYHPAAPAPAPVPAAPVPSSVAASPSATATTAAAPSTTATATAEPGTSIPTAKTHVGGHETRPVATAHETPAAPTATATPAAPATHHPRDVRSPFE